MKLLSVLLILLLATAFAAADEEDTLFKEVGASILVFDPIHASEILSFWAEENGGYFTWKSEDSVRLRVPDLSINSFRSFLEDNSEFVIQYNQSTRDLREELSGVRSALEAREEILQKNLTYLSSSDMEGTLELEREIRRLMGEIDRYKGQLRRLENDSRMAVIQVELSFQHQSIPDTRPSRFDWINGLDFYDFMYITMQNNGGPGFSPAAIPLPEGFALVDKSPEFLAISPEGVRLRVRKVKNYPEQSVDFWIDTLEKELSNRGYISVDKIPDFNWLEDKSFDFSLWALPWGNDNYLYLTGLRVEKGRIEILEMAGSSEYMLQYLE